MMTTFPGSKWLRAALGAGLLAACGVAGSYELYNEGGTELKFEAVAVGALLESQRNYDGRPGGSSWREGFAKYGFAGSTQLFGSSTVYGALNLLSSGTWKGGDAGGLSDGTERRTRFEDAFLGWRSGEHFAALGSDGVDVSVGRQAVRIGSGFLVMDDGFNPGRGPAGGALDRGGAYYLAARHAFAQTAVLRLGGAQGLHGSVMYLGSDNRGQANSAFSAATLEHTSAPGTLGLTYLHGQDVDERFASPRQLLRKGMDVYSVRGEGSAGIENASFAFELARQETREGASMAGYAQAGYTFADLPWTPSLTYRYGRYGARWDPLFTGGFRTWLQGEVAANYAGPFNSNTRIHHTALTFKPLDNLSLSAMYFNFRTLRDRQLLNLDAQEIDLIAEWTLNPNLVLMPIIGIYKPRRDASNGGNQGRGRSTNLNAQLLLVASF